MPKGLQLQSNKNCDLEFQDVERWSCVTVIRLCDYLELAWTMPASDDLCRVKLSRDTATSPLLSVSLLMFSFLLPLCFVHSFSRESWCQAHIQWFAWFWLPAHRRRQLKCFSSAPSLFPKLLACHHIPVPVHSNQNSCQSLWFQPPTRDFPFLNLIESRPASFCCKSHAPSCSC